MGLAVFYFTQQAFKLQGRETERRLGDLNHEGARLASAVAANVSADTWKAFIDTYAGTQHEQANRFNAIERFQNKLLGAMGLAVVVVPILTGVIVYVLTRHAVPVGK